MASKNENKEELMFALSGFTILFNFSCRFCATHHLGSGLKILFEIFVEHMSS